MIDGNGVMRRVAEFEAKHGASVYDGAGFILFEDGAWREKNPIGRLAEPPTDPKENAKARAKYWKVMRYWAVKEFDQYRDGIIHHSRGSINSSFPPPAPDPKEVRKRLKDLKAKVTEAEAALKKIEEEIEANRPAHEIERERQAAENRRAHEEVLSVISSIEV